MKIPNKPKFHRVGGQRGRWKIMVNSGLMTIEDLAGYLRVTRRTIYEWLKHKKIPAIKLVGQWRFKKEKIDAWIDSKGEIYAS